MTLKMKKLSTDLTRGKNTDLYIFSCVWMTNHILYISTINREIKQLDCSASQSNLSSQVEELSAAQCTFIDYAPLVFHRIRLMDGISPQEYMVSLQQQITCHST